MRIKFTYEVKIPTGNGVRLGRHELLFGEGEYTRDLLDELLFVLRKYSKIGAIAIEKKEMCDKNWIKDIMIHTIDLREEHGVSLSACEHCGQYIVNKTQCKCVEKRKYRKVVYDVTNIAQKVTVARGTKEGCVETFDVPKFYCVYCGRATIGLASDSMLCPQCEDKQQNQNVLKQEEANCSRSDKKITPSGTSYSLYPVCTKKPNAD